MHYNVYLSLHMETHTHSKRIAFISTEAQFADAETHTVIPPNNKFSETNPLDLT